MHRHETAGPAGGDPGTVGSVRAGCRGRRRLRALRPRRVDEQAMASESRDLIIGMLNEIYLVFTAAPAPPRLLQICRHGAGIFAGLGTIEAHARLSQARAPWRPGANARTVALRQIFLCLSKTRRPAPDRRDGLTHKRFGRRGHRRTRVSMRSPAGAPPGGRDSKHQSPLASRRRPRRPTSLALRGCVCWPTREGTVAAASGRRKTPVS